MIDIVDFSDCPLSDRDLSYGGQSGPKRGIFNEGRNEFSNFLKVGL